MVNTKQEVSKSPSIKFLEEARESKNLQIDSQDEDTQVTTYGESQFNELDDSQAMDIESSATRCHKAHPEHCATNIGCITTSQ